MNFKNILIATIFILSINNINAVTVDEYGMYKYTDGTATVTWDNASKDANCNVYASRPAYMKYVTTYGMLTAYFNAPIETNNGNKVYATSNDPEWYTLQVTAHNIATLQKTDYTTISSTYSGWLGEWGTLSMTCIFYDPNNQKTLTGDIGCISEITLYIYDIDTSTFIKYMYNNTYDVGGDSYSFNIINGETFKIVFDGDHEYEFICDGNEVYDYNVCVYTTYRFEESCGNLIPDSEGYYCEDWTGGGGICYTFHEHDAVLDISNTSLDGVTIYTNSFVGQKWWYFNNPITNHTYNCINTGIDWRLKVIVQNGSDGTLIDDAMVKVDQSCYCTHGGTSVRQKKTVNGMVSFGEMSLQDASLFVMKYGYKILDENSTGYSAFLSGRSNFSFKTWIVKLAPSWSNNSSTFYEVSNKVDIHFRNEDGDRTSKIFDTDTEVYLYYENNNSNEEAMTLKFQSSSTHSHFINEQSWTIAYDDIGHKTIANSYFTPWNYAYRAVIYNSSIYGWNMTIPLTVRNGTKEEDQHYENLTTNLWFMFEKDGKIDYREDMEIVSHAGSNNTTLMNIDLEIWKDGALLCYKNLTVTDYAGADFPYYYIYEPVYDYVSGSNYTAKMYGFDRTLLEVRYLECMTDNTTRKNRLTISVKDRSGANLDNCYIYLEDWGSLSTGLSYYNAYEGIDNGYYRYKASKSGYSGTGWADVTLSDDDEIVWYTLTEDYTNMSATQQKLTDDDIKGIFFPLMFFLLICIVFGGFKYVSS